MNCIGKEYSVRLCTLGNARFEAGDDHTRDGMYISPFSLLYMCSTESHFSLKFFPH